MNKSERNYTTTAPDKQSRFAEAKFFFDSLFGKVSGEYWGYLWTVSKDNRRTTYPFMVTDATQRDLMASRAIELSDSGLTVYFGVNISDKKPSRYERFTNEKRTVKKNGKERETIPVAVQTAVICDIDIEGGTHKQGDGKIYAPDFDTAKSFLPFKPSFIINSGYGLHAYCIFANPLTITDENRQAANRRNVGYISAIRSNAGDCDKTADGVGDLARVLRVPGTRNYKMGISENEPLCRIVEATDLRFTQGELDEKIAALMPKQQESPKPPKIDNAPHERRKTQPTEQERALAMLLYVYGGNYDIWYKVGMILKANGNTLEDWERWSATQPNYTPDKPEYNCAEKWATFPENNGMTIATLHKWAVEGGYSEADFLRDWYNQHPESKKSARRNRIAELQAQPQTKSRDVELIAAIRDACEWRYSKDANGTLRRVSIKPTFANMKLIFDNDPNIQRIVGYDEFQSASVFLRQPPWRMDTVTGEEWGDCDDALLRLYIRENYGELSSHDLIQDFAVKVSRENAFHPVKDYFRKLPPWDGTPRAETLFIKFLRVEDTPFAREVTLNWLLAAIARIFNPGCRYQTALVLHGAQKIGKSYIIERLGGKWYMELVDDVDDTHASDAIRKGWIVELKEMAAMRKAELNKVKAFIERSAETRRLAYGHHATTLYRHCVFVITVNDSEFLRDTTGNRRYLILHCNSPMFGYVEGLTDEFISQIWAEVYQRYNEMFKDGFDEKALELSRDAQFKAEEIATRYMQDDGLANEIKGYLNTPIPADVVWLHLTKEERRKFIADGKIFIGGGKAELETRIKNRKWNKSAISADVQELWKLLASENERTAWRNGGEAGLYLYGTQLRKHICMTEIFNECFGNDNRKKTYRITEILTMLDGWTLGARLQKADPQYPDQTKPYYRNEPAQEELQPETQHNDLTDLPLDPLEAPPF